MSVIDSSKAIAPAGTWAVDPVHSSIQFEVGHTGVSVFRGSFDEYVVTLTGGEEPVLEGTAAVASVNVKDADLSAHLLTPDFFDAQRHPTIAFRASDLRRLDGDRLEAHGELTLKGVTRPVVLTGSVSSPATDPFGRERLGLRLETTIDRTDFGVSWNAPLPGGGDYVANEVRLLAELSLIQQGA